ncbi:unnamed protein product, partial [Ceratitis capitata]
DNENHMCGTGISNMRTPAVVGVNFSGKFFNKSFDIPALPLSSLVRTAITTQYPMMLQHSLISLLLLVRT